MSDTVIIAEDLSKLYRIGVARKPAESLTGAALSWLKAPVRNFRELKALDTFRAAANGRDKSDDLIWALHQVSFEVKRGDVVGIIGRNGAGKSTLLKILSRITRPTAGRARMRGRLSALLEVGTGFHADLTGRENIYLNGTILGMSKREIDRKFDEIVDFSGVERFLDTPVKRYSSGMHVRLAFSVAAHLEPDIIVLDEVLAVGDVAFQKKCLGKMGDVARHGRTVLFVSHNLSAVNSLCRRVLVMDNGQLDFDGPTREGIERYMQRSAARPAVDLTNADQRVGRGEYGRFVSIALFNDAGQPCDSFAMGDSMVIELTIECTKRLRGAEIGLLLDNSMGTHLHAFRSTWEGLHCDLDVGRHLIRITIPRLLVFPGTYSLSCWMRQGKSGVDDEVCFAIWFNVIGADLTGHRADFQEHADNIYASKCEVYCPSRWHHVAPSKLDQPTLTGAARA
jgi:lipopolysaccharide transport system ATP-binding protein